ncbi:flagellin [uncultured Clostridium sp.]|uniref:flagellin N-terminal helical domain-containing protein n=2 Tax=Clostridium TaxID=1485 RepID=UPI0026717953|nr:flagellin [uncultured Clostridium sp.]
MIINHNMNAMNAHRNMGVNNNNAAKAMEKLSSGLRINRAGDDAAGLAISEKMRGQIRGLDQASRNAQDGISLIQTAEGALNETTNILQRMRELSVQAANDTNATTDRVAIRTELTALQDEITRIADTTKFNGKNLINSAASKGSALNIQVGANSGEGIKITLANMAASVIGVTTTLVSNISAGSSTDANKLTTAIDNALVKVSTQRAKFGAIQNRLEHTIKNVDNTSENLQAAESRIRDVDMAKEMMNYSKNNILNQAAQSMLAQANQQPQNVLNLLR